MIDAGGVARAMRLVVLSVVCMTLSACKPSPPPEDPPPTPKKSDSLRTAEAVQVAIDQKGKLSEVELVSQVQGFCGTCHLAPPPELLPKWAWPKQIELMYELAGVARDTKLDKIPPLDQTVKYFVERAPEKETLPKSYAHFGPGSFFFRTSAIGPPDTPPTPAVSYLRLVNLFDRPQPDLLACNMDRGAIMIQHLSLPDKPFQLIPFPFPAKAEVVDLDQDGHKDLLVAGLGSMTPSDHDNGVAAWIRGPRFDSQPIPLLDEIGRVSDVQADDLDGDGDLDVVVAAFGWRNSGKVYLLENITDPKHPTKVEFARREVLDPRPGALNVAIVDIDGDGRKDIVSLLAQQHETLVVYRNLGEMNFDLAPIFQAPHPAWGSSGFEVTDLDQDGDPDILMVNGDALDTFVLRPYHGVSWLENDGSGKFAKHELGTFPGAHKARAVDLDGDGDLDVVASSWLPLYFPMETVRKPLNLESLIWFEQTKPGEFERHSLEKFLCDHPSLEVGDYDADGDIDIMVGNCIFNPAKSRPIKDWIVLFENMKPPEQPVQTKQPSGQGD